MTQGSSLLSGDARNSTTATGNKMSVITGPRMRETIHSGHFMVSDFEPESEAQDEEYEVGMPIPPGPDDTVVVQAPPTTCTPVVSVADIYNPPMMMMQMEPVMKPPELPIVAGPSYNRSPMSMPLLNTSISIDGSLTKLFQCMSLAYRQKLTSPKWNRFKGVRLRWKDKIRLNNVIWRCWHMQFILKQRTLVCQFASPLDVDQHNKPEAVVMEGKYWKRKLSTVAAEYKKWRLFYRNKMMGWTHKDPTPDLHPVSLDGFDWNRAAPFGNSILFDDDLLMDFSDTLFSSISSQPFAFPNPREIARAGMVADFIQPGLVQLQPNLEDFMDTLEPLQDYVNSKLLPPVPEELDSYSDNLLPVEGLPPLIQKTASLNSKQQSVQGSGNQQSGPLSLGNGGIRGQSSNSSSYSSSITQQQTNYFQMAEMNGGPRQGQHQQQATPVSVVMSVPQQQQKQQQSQQQSNSSSSSNSSLLKDSHSHHREAHSHQSTSSSTRGGYSSRHDVFAKPVGKPRGRSRSGISGRQILTSNASPAAASCPPPTSPQSNMSHQTMHSNMSHSQMSNTMSNSTTLLSHLLTTTGNGNHYSGSVGLDKMGSAHGNNVGIGGASSMMQSASSSSSGILGSVPMPQQELQQHSQTHHHHHQQQQQTQSQQQQPWNPKNANETLNPNVPIHFGLGKPMLQLNQNQHSTNVGGMSSGAGNISPPLLSNTPSPPMGPPIGGPASPSKPFRPKSDTDREHRRVCHINAEQKRRCNIKNGFDMLHSLIPQLSHNPNAKVNCDCGFGTANISVSKAAMLQKGAEYIRQLKLERAQLKEEIEAHRQEVDALNSAINNCQSMLPATGAPVSRQRTNKMKEMFDQWVRCRTTENWKFWIFSILIRPLLDSYNNSVSTASVDEMCRTVLAWVDQHCSLVDLRPGVLNSLRYLCTTTDILTNPGNLPDEAYKAVNRPPRDNSERDPR